MPSETGVVTPHDSPQRSMMIETVTVCSELVVVILNTATTV